MPRVTSTGAPSSKLSPSERRALRRAGVIKQELGRLPARELHGLTGLPMDRCTELTSLLQFESFTSVGPSVAQDLWSLGYRSIDDLRGEKPRAMYERLCELVGHRVDPCAQDVFHAAVAQAQDPDLPPEQRNWWYWTAFREAGSPTGGPASRRAGRRTP